MIHYKRYTTDLGEVDIAAGKDGVIALQFHHKTRPLPLAADWQPGATALTDRAAQQLREYLAAKRRHFHLPLAPRGTVFQRRVWEALLAIPYGETRSYTQQAQQLGQPRAIRAVARANGANPVAVVIPCHRVIGANGTLTGYAGGLPLKAHLLTLEGAEFAAPCP
ncbi:methylated-DNA--[protein]-cysteine S-methyltransferase [Microbulbifer spongiae]|uniref:Methylated-DNA--protein-cysteine methyltransferase n=1 Tax=Microbulbifer spongiae TaxID=2944933 RepID=A0ABY9E6Z2_9GAMM|nr:methylated-DNA--[protein]-cysteine S-methyltransferase [Microbulbifer sp. MI-G]WKD48447.1 methylated-DNA--[protein]-cysteine S-methyltransferase [Microbulbifer sp. MI-G]